MGAKQSGTATSTQKLDPQMQAMIGQLFGTALGATGTSAPGGGAVGAGGAPNSVNGVAAWMKNRGNPQPGVTPIGPQAQPVPGVDPMSAQAGGYYGDAMRAGNLGFNALSGDQGAIDSLYNPYQKNVIDAVNAGYGDVRADTMNSVNDYATKANAFGGSRHGVATGQALGDVAKDQMGRVAGLQYQGFNDAMGRAGGLANLGMAGAGAAHGMGEYNRQVAMQQDPVMRNLEILKGVIHGTPYGTSTSTPMYSNPLSGLLGLGSMAGGLGWSPFAAGGGAAAAGAQAAYNPLFG